MDTKVIDTAGHFITSQGYGRTEIVQSHGVMLRVAVKVDAYAKQSSATVAMLNSLGTWTDLIDLPVSLWHGSAPSYTARDERPEKFTRELADELIERATNFVDAWKAPVPG